MDLLQKKQVMGSGASRSDGGQTESSEEDEQRKPLLAYSV